MSQRAAAHPQESVARTIRIPAKLRKRIVESAPSADEIIALAVASLADTSPSDLELLTRKLTEISSD
jgi:hypothetical protein